MTSEEFYREYANLPLSYRRQLVVDPDYPKGFGISLDDIYKEISDIDNKIRADVIRKEHLLQAFQTFKIKDK